MAAHILAAGAAVLASQFAAVSADQIPLQASSLFQEHTLPASAGRKLQGRFLHITDIHPDPYYKIHSDPEEGACHSKHGSAGYYGAETTDCDSPYSLVNATFKWIEENLKDSIDFVIWTGDSARHDNDEDFPRHERQIIGQNEFLMGKMLEVFGKSGNNHLDAFEIPIVPTIGNNDILPHNILARGPNKWTKTYAQVWKQLIPEAQKHSFEEGAWFFVEVIPKKLAVFSLNTMYFFNNNAAVDGCNDHSEPGYEQMEWLRIQLQFLRERGLKAVMTGHVPPARNDQKASWHETCWQKYTLWMRQYRDVVVGAMWGHMNIEHFLLHDFHDIEYNVARGHSMLSESEVGMELASDEGDEIIHVAKAADYLASLRHQWSKLPDRPLKTTTANDTDEVDTERKRRRKKRSKTQKQYHKEVGGEWAERFAISFISPSVIPNYFPSLRVFEYNITGLEHVSVHGNPMVERGLSTAPNDYERYWYDEEDAADAETDLLNVSNKHKKHKKSKKRKKGKKKQNKPKFAVPKPPSTTAPPGPAYSPQTLSWLGYTEYYTNLTRINNEPADDENVAKSHKGRKHRAGTPDPKNFTFEVEFNTRDADDVYDLGDGLLVRNMLDLASRIGDYEPSKGDKLDSDADLGSGSLSNDQPEQEVDDIDVEKKKHKKKKHRKHKRRRIINRTWFAFVDRALVGTASTEDLHRDFGQEPDD